jgi:hypothetical protein
VQTADGQKCSIEIPDNVIRRVKKCDVGYGGRVSQKRFAVYISESGSGGRLTVILARTRDQEHA